MKYCCNKQNTSLTTKAFDFYVNFFIIFALCKCNKYTNDALTIFINSLVILDTLLVSNSVKYSDKIGRDRCVFMGFFTGC